MFRPALRSGWLSYIRQNYRDPDGVVEAVGPAVGEGMLVLPDWKCVIIGVIMDVIIVS